MKISGVCGKITGIVVFLLMLTVVFGCSSGGSEPMTPVENDAPIVSGDLSNGHNLLGIYTIQIDTVNMVANIILDRSSSIHFNAAPFLMNICPHCILVFITGFNPDERIYKLDVELLNPTGKIAYDVKGTILLDGTGEFDLMNPDVYTPLWGTEPSPFRYFAKSATNYIFPPAAVHVEEFELYISEDHTPTFSIPFALDIHWPGIQEDPIWIENIEVDNNGANVTIDCDVIDAQDNLERVFADTTAFIGAETDFVNTSGNHYRVTFPVGSAPGGLNKVLLSAKSEGTNVLLHHYADVFVAASGAILEGHVFSAITTWTGVGTKVTVKNTVSGGSNLYQQLSRRAVTISTTCNPGPTISML